MSKTLKKLKGFWNLGVAALLSLMFTSGARAITPPPGNIGTFYGTVAPEAISFPLIGVFLAFIITPIIGLFWYRKRGGTKRWPSIVVWTLVALFIVTLISLIIFLYSSS